MARFLNGTMRNISQKTSFTNAKNAWHQSITVEYSLKNHKVLQCYAKYNTKPDANVLEFVNKKWLPYANRKIKNIAN